MQGAAEQGPHSGNRRRKGDGPGRGDNRGRRRAKLRGGGAGAPARSTPRGSEQCNGGPLHGRKQLCGPTFLSIARWSASRGVIDGAKQDDLRDTPRSPAPVSPGRGALSPPDTAPVSAGAGSCLTRTPRWHPAGGVPSAVSRLGLPSVKSHMSHRDKPVTIGPTSGLPARGCPTCSRWSSDSRQSIHFPVYSCGAAKVSLDFSDTTGSAGAQPRRPARTASQIRRPSSAPATMACEQWPSQRATPSGDPVPYAARAPR